MEAAALDDLEGAGQAKRLTARLCAEVHNAIRYYAWQVHGSKDSQPPEAMRETDFLPVRIKQERKPAIVPEKPRTKREAQQDEIERSLRSFQSALGF